MLLDETYKEFPPGWGHVRIPTSSRAAALSGLSMYAPCRPRAVWALRSARAAVRVLGPLGLPGRRSTWQPPLRPELWAALLELWRREVAEFDTLAVYERVQAHRPGLALMLLRAGKPIGFVRLRRDDPSPLSAERLVLDLLAKSGPSSFQIPRCLSHGEHAGWHYSLVTPVLFGAHRVPANAPVRLIAREIEAGLAELPRPADTPTHWLPMHGDLTPWNLRQIRDGGLVLVDWEEARWGPPNADLVLYTAVDAALRGVSTGPCEWGEAIDFWKRELGARPVKMGRDRRLAHSLLETLTRMRSSAPSRAAPPRPTRRPRVLVFAYACEPGRGSEPGAGWGLVRAAAEFADCVVLVAPEHTQGITRWQTEHPDSTIRFVEVHEPSVAPYSRWHRIPWFLLYLAWLRNADRVARELHSSAPFDAALHATYATYWLPTPAARLGIPCVWGPVGGAARTPVRLWPILGWKGALDELLDWASVRLAAWSPGTRRTWRGVTAAIVQNEETFAMLPDALRDRARVMNHNLFIEVPDPRPVKRESWILSLAALEPRKGPRLAIRALAHTPGEVRLVLAGEGPERGALRRLARRLRVEHRIRFLGHVSRDRIFELLEEAGAVLFTTPREEGGLALAEAMLCGAPVIVLASGGSRSAAASTTDPERVALVQPAGVRETARRLGDAMTRFSCSPPPGEGPTLDQEAARRSLQELFHQALGGER